MHLPFGKASMAAIFWLDNTQTEDRVQTRWLCGEVNQKWGSYSNVQQRYNGFTNEWDICTDFGDDPMGMDFDKDKISFAEDN